MARVIRARYENGVLKPLDKPDLEEGEETNIVVVKRDLSKYRGVLGKASYEELKELEGEAHYQA